MRLYEGRVHGKAGVRTPTGDVLKFQKNLSTEQGDINIT